VVFFELTKFFAKKNELLQKVLENCKIICNFAEIFYAV